MSQAATTAGASEITLREPGDDDVQECARICYQALGFKVTEPVVIMSGKPRSVPVDGVEVRSLEVGDLDACETLCKQVHGWERTGELRDAMQAFAPFVVVRDGQVAGYLTTATMWPMAHGVAATEADMEALL